MKKCMIIIIIIMILLAASTNGSGEKNAWDCPDCGRDNNVGNYCGGCGHPAPWLETDKTETVIVEKLQLRKMNQYVAAGSTFTVAITENGSCVKTGKNAPDISTWKNIVFICSNGKNVAGIKNDGTVVCTNAALKVSTWKEITMLDYNSEDPFTGEHIVGLRRNGTVLATGSNKYGECNVTEWDSIVDISAGFTHTVGLRSDGTVVAVGDNTYGQCETAEWTDIVDVAAARYSSYGLKSNGQIVATGVFDTDFCVVGREPQPKYAENIYWDDIVAIVADNDTGSAKDYVIGIKKDGSIITNRTDHDSYITDDEVPTISDVVSLDCSSWGYIVCINSQGKAHDIGWDADGKRKVSQWDKLKTND